MYPFTFDAIEVAFRSTSSRDLCSEDDLPYWSAENPSQGHCGVVALTHSDLFGGDLLVATVQRDGVHTGYHYWNRLAGLDVDLTRDQFLPGEVVGQPDVVARPEGRPKRYAEEYEAFRSLVFDKLGINIGTDQRLQSEASQTP